MIEGQSGYVPLSELDHPDIIVDIPFPSYIDRDLLGFHSARIEQLSGLGGLRKIHFLGHLGGDISSTTPEIGSVSRSGEANAVATVTTRTINPFSFTRNTSPQLLVHLEEDVTINLNLDEIINRIRYDPRYEKGIRDTVAWANYLDQAAKKSIRQAGTKNLIFSKTLLSAGIIGKGETIDKSLQGAAIFAYLVYFYGLGHGFYLPVPEASVAFSAGIYFAFNWRKGYDDAARRRIDTGIKSYRFSAICGTFGPQIDRAIVLQLLSRTQKLVKSL